MKKFNGKKKIVAGCALVLAVGVAAVSLMGMGPGGDGAEGFPGMEAEEPSNRTVVETAMPHYGDITVSGSFVGTVEPGQQVTVYPKVANGAEVLSVNYSVGDTVEAGAVLFQLDSSTLELTIAKAQVELANAEAQAELKMEMAEWSFDNFLVDVDDGLNSSLMKAQAELEAAELALEKANNDYRLARNAYNDYMDGKNNEEFSEAMRDSLRNTRVLAELQVEGAQITLENCKAALEATQRAIEQSVVSTQNDIRALELGSDMTASYIALQQQQKTLADYTVTAPISGVIEARNVDPFDMVASSTPAFIISNKEAMTITFNVTETTLNYMAIGDHITVEKNGQSAIGTITEISTMTTSGGLYTVKASVSGAPFALHSGSTLKLYADTQKVENELLIPIDAVYYDNGAPYVYVFQNNTANKVEIETGISDDTYIQVLSGLRADQELIVTWSASLFDGAEVYLPGSAPAVTNSGSEQGEPGRAADAEPAGSDDADSADDADETGETDSDTDETADNGDGERGDSDSAQAD